MQTSERTRAREKVSERERDNKSMLNPSLSNFRNFERHKSSLTAVSTHKLSSGSWTRCVRNRRPTAIARYNCRISNFRFHANAKRDLLCVRESNSSTILVFYQRANAIIAEWSLVHVLWEYSSHTNVSAFPFLNYRGETGRRTVPFYVCKNHKA